MKLTCAIIDDEPLAVELLESYVRKTPFLELKGAYNGGITALEALKTEPVDLLFCDIQMPELSGMELSRMLPTRTRVVFTTAFDRYAVEGFRVGAVDYLLKPISYGSNSSAAASANHRLQEPAPKASSSRPNTGFGRSNWIKSSTSKDSRTT